ncbi:Zinc finger protein 40 [Eumeta japonica]|uniref:Zinc finger protein 40 n=1 Tax=Eumeta variegata TaxID=151549 RepID=A0A4C1VNQ8_EUMVA|nr:Zinc finger protein 40 [Eumeta japonica]
MRHESLRSRRYLRSGGRGRARAGGGARRGAARGDVCARGRGARAARGARRTRPTGRLTNTKTVIRCAGEGSASARPPPLHIARGLDYGGLIVFTSSGTKGPCTMPLTQEKPLDCNFINNNDHNYLHKKFKKMASTAAIPSSQPPKNNENERLDHVAQSSSNSYISNGSIAAAHPEIEKKKSNEDSYMETQIEKNVQISNNECNRISLVNNIYKSGQTSITEEFSNKTENLENDFLKDVHNGMAGGRYVCPYCNLPCAKPSVLQKHIRAHTNERPYPCIPCGFAFKTKSNLYKHRRSRTHALRLQGVDASTSMNEDDWSAGSESDTSLPPTSISDAGSEGSVFRIENSRPSEISSPETTSERTSPMNFNLAVGENNKIKTIYKPKFRAFSRSEFSEEEEEKYKTKKIFPTNAEFLNEHISKIISDNEAIVDVIDTPLQKKYSKIKQIAENKQLLTNEKFEVRSDHSPLNLTKNCNEIEHPYRKLCHSEHFSQLENNKHPLNPEGSIIKDLLLKTKSSSNGIISTNSETVDGIGNLYICPLCQIPYQSAENLEIHRLHYCKGNVNSGSNTDNKTGRPDIIFGRSNSVNMKFSESSLLPKFNISLRSPPFKNKPDNLIIIKPELNDVVAPLPSPGPLLGNTRLVDSRTPPEISRKSESLIKSVQSPKRKLENRSECYSPRLIENISPRTIDLYSQSKVRCIDANATTLRSIDDVSQGSVRHNSTSLQMFGGEVKIVDHSGSTTTLRIEPSKNPLSPILIHQNLSPSKLPHDVEPSSIVVRSGLHSGGTMVHNPPTPKEPNTPHPQTPRSAMSVSPDLQTPNICSISDIHFRFPPLGAITAFNPLTLPPLSPSLSPNGATTILHGGKIIPHVPGMPGPNTHSLYIGNPNLKSKTVNNNEFKKNLPELSKDEVNGKLLSVNIQSGKHQNIFKLATSNLSRNPTVRTIHKEVSNENTFPINTIPHIKINNVEETDNSKMMISAVTKLNTRQEVLVKRTSDVLIKTTMPIENVNNQHKKIKTMEKNNVSEFKTTDYAKKAEAETRNFNFENLITKAEIFNNQIPSSSEVQKNTNAQETPNSAHNERSETLYFQKNVNVKSVVKESRPKFLRPSTLPLKPGTFTPKRHHGITPNANTMPLVSPETPRPAKAYGQLYLNGNAYTYLGLKCSTKVFYCTINRPQPTYVPNQHFLSMYSNWQLLSELTPDPLGLSAATAMSLYDSRHRPQSIAIAEIRQDLILTHSSQWNKHLKDAKQSSSPVDTRTFEETKVQSPDGVPVPKKELTGGFESNEEYTYVRGRGRGRYVCSECGIRCKKPSMLKKHIRTHTDVRPYTCTHCSFSFKTKGNLTKHMKSKAHYKKCCELGINPNEGTDMEVGEMTQGSGETDEESDSEGDEGNEGETESSDTETCKSRLPEHEAAHCLLSLGGSRPPTSATPGLITSARPSTYPYTPLGLNIALEAKSPLVSEKTFITINTPTDSGIELENEPMDLSKTETKINPPIPEIPTERESSVLASLASNTAKLPQYHTQWANGEPMLHAYLTERALLDTRIKQSQLTCSLPKVGKLEIGKILIQDKVNSLNNSYTAIVTPGNVILNSLPELNDGMKDLNKEELESDRRKDGVSKDENVQVPSSTGSNIPSINSDNLNNVSKSYPEHTTSVSDSAKYVVSEYLKMSKANSINENSHLKINENRNNLSNNGENPRKIDELLNDESESLKRPILEHDPIARKVVIGAGGVAFKMASKGQDFEPTATYTPGRLIEDGRRVCDFCNKTFTKPSQLRLHLNIHYMERPFRCSACAVSFRTRGHLQKHERSGSHHNKVSMTSTFGAATSLNPRPFRCSDCNIAFRIHGHLAKHLRSKMHVMRLECLFKLPFGTFTEIERAGVSLTDIDTTDCASSLASLQLLAQKLHEKDPTKLEYRDSNCATGACSAPKDASEDEDGTLSVDKANERDSESRIILNNECQERSESYI